MVYAHILFLFLAGATAPPPDHSFTFSTQNGPAATHPAVADGAGEGKMLAAAQSLADRRGEAVAVTQRGRFVTLLNPRKKP